MVDRPALRMTVTGAADPVSEREAMQAGRGQWGRAEGGPPWGPVSPAG